MTAFASLLPPALALGFAVGAGPVAPAAPDPVAAPAPAGAPAAPLEVAREVSGFLVRRTPDGTLVLTPNRDFEFTPEADDAARLPRWIEMAFPAGTRRTYAARSETLLTVPKGAVLELSNLVGDILVDGWNKNEVRIVAQHGPRDRMQARVVEMSRRVEAVRRRLEELKREARERERERGGADAEARQRALAARQKALQEQAARTAVLQVETLNRLGIPAAVDYNITVPQWMTVKLSGMESDISVAGVRAAIAAESVRGDVNVRGGRGDVQISSVEGEVRAYDCDCDVDASSINNDVELDDVTGALVVQSVNGDIQIGKVKSPSVQASSVNGTVIYRGAFEPRGRYRLASHAGNLVVGVPVDAGVDVSVATFQGGFRTAFPVQVGPWRKGEKFNFVLGSGGSSLELESFQGVIELLRPGEVPVAPEAPEARPAPAPEVREVRIVRKTPRVPKPPKAPKAPEDDERDE